MIFPISTILWHCFFVSICLHSALKWAIAANRPDLMEKKLSCITKYYLCSEHFSDDCFSDPPNNTRLKKTLYPLNIPVPTIFKCNIDKYIPSTKRTSVNDDTDDGERTKRQQCAYGSISMESLSVFHDHYNYADISSCSASFFNDDFQNENSFDCDALNHITEEIPHTIFNCRLCAKSYTSTEHLTDLSVEPTIYDKLNSILPNQVLISLNISNIRMDIWIWNSLFSFFLVFMQIKSDDHLSHQACNNCLEKLNTCIDIINSFKDAQLDLQKNYGINWYWM